MTVALTSNKLNFEPHEPLSFRIQTLESQITELQRETARLLSTLEVQKNTIDEYQAQSSKMETEHTRQTKKLEQEISALKEKVAQYADYDEIKRELEIIKVKFLSQSNCNHHQILHLINTLTF